MNISITVSVGELLDKITILKIKTLYSDNPYLYKELNSLVDVAKKYDIYKPEWIDELYRVNSLLWDIEDKIRLKEKNNEFDDEFIILARSVYINNDKRAAIKKQINESTDSNFKEIKIFTSDLNS